MVVSVIAPVATVWLVIGAVRCGLHLGRVLPDTRGPVETGSVVEGLLARSQILLPPMLSHECGILKRSNV
jgi:hypothetical protein